MSHHKIDFVNICYTYPDGTNAVDNISFSVNHGESVGILGGNGAGKSTLLMLLMGLIFPKKGQIYVGDILLHNKTLNLIRQRIGMIFQNSDDQLFTTSVYEDVAFGPRNMGLTNEEVEKRVEEALIKVGILHLKDRPPYRLSGGEKRAAAIASVISMKPDVLVMDEPSTGLDPKSRKRLINLMNDFEHTKIITSHDMEMILETCHRVILINNGKVAADGPALEIFADEKTLDICGLEKPYSLRK